MSVGLKAILMQGSVIPVKLLLRAGFVLVNSARRRPCVILHHLSYGTHRANYDFLGGQREDSAVFFELFSP